jgi:hypothetical protein
MQFSEVVMPAGWRILVGGEEPVVSFLRAEGEAGFGTGAILEHPGPDWYTGVWLGGRRGYEGQMRTVTYRGGVNRIEPGPEDEFWALAGPPDDEDDEPWRRSSVRLRRHRAVAAQLGIMDVRVSASAASPAGQASPAASSYNDHRAWSTRG